jgi:transcriptional regulator of acetoin/glycerol metabolism
LRCGPFGWLLAARFAEPAPLEPWRRDFLRYLAACFFDSGQGLKELRAAEVMRVLALVGGNISEAARRLGVQRPTIYKALERAGLRSHKLRRE